MKNGIDDWVKRVSKDEEFGKKFKGKNANEISELAKKEGFNFTPEEYMDLRMEAAAGGFDWENIEDKINSASETIDKVTEYVKKGAKVTSALSDRPLTGLELYEGLEKIRNDSQQSDE